MQLLQYKPYLFRLKDIYGDSIDKILQGNTSNIIYLKSTDDSMLDTLSKLSGERHESYKNSRSVSKDVAHRYSPTEGKIQETTSVQVKPVITKTDMLLIPNANSMVFGRGNPIWNRNQTALPMAWRLHQNGLPHASGIEGYQLNTVPSTSNTDDFDILGNQPDFYKMVAKRCEQAKLAQGVKDKFLAVNGIDESGFEKLDPDSTAQEIMGGINENLAEQHHQNVNDAAEQQAAVMDSGDDLANLVDPSEDEDDSLLSKLKDSAETNTLVADVVKTQTDKRDDELKKRYAHQQLSRADLMMNGHANHQLDSEIKDAYGASQAYFQQDNDFTVNEYGSLYNASGDTCFIESVNDPGSHLNKDEQDFNNGNSPENKVFDRTESEHTDEQSQYQLQFDVTDAFYKYLYDLPDWSAIARGAFDDEMAKAYQIRNQANSAI